MESIWSRFISENKAVLPYIPLAVILQAFYWYIEAHHTTDFNNKFNCKANVLKLLDKTE